MAYPGPLDLDTYSLSIAVLSSAISMSDGEDGGVGDWGGGGGGVGNLIGGSNGSSSTGDPFGD